VLPLVVSFMLTVQMQNMKPQPEFPKIWIFVYIQCNMFVLKLK